MPDQVERGPTWERDVMEKALTASVVEQRRGRRWSVFFKLIILAYVLFLTFSWFKSKTKPALHDHVALIDLIGTIGQGQEIDADQVGTSLRHAFDEPKVKAIILRINSPGGTPVQGAYIHDELRRLRALHPDKKVYAVAVDVCASAAYFIAVGADYIYANRSSLIGSIGVLLPGFGAVDAIKKLGLEQRTLFSGKNKMFLDPFSEINPAQVDFAHSLLEDVHQHFITAVKEGRGNRLKPNDDMFSGLYWTGDKALALGLIDGLGSAGYVAREVIKIDEIVDYTPSHTLLERLTTRFGTSMAKQLSSDLGLQRLR